LYCRTRSKKFSPINKKDLGMAYHTPSLKKVKMGLRLGNGGEGGAIVE